MKPDEPIVAATVGCPRSSTVIQVCGNSVRHVIVGRDIAHLAVHYWRRADYDYWPGCLTTFTPSGGSKRKGMPSG